MKQEIFVSLDVEFDGPIPGPNSMLSFGLVALTIEKVVLGVLRRNLKPLPGASPNPETMAWWNATPERAAAYAKTRENVVAIWDAMGSAETFFEELARIGKPVFVAAPAGDDALWFHWYCQFALGRKLRRDCIDMKSVAMVILQQPYHALGKHLYKKAWFDEGLPHTHVAHEDALEQGALFVNMLRESRALPAIPGVTHAF